MVEVVQSLLPVVLMIVLGAGLLRFGFIDDAFRRGLDRFVYWVALPSLFVGKLAVGSVVPADVQGLAAVMIGAMAIATAVGAVVAWALRLPRAGFGVFVQASMRGNLVFVGLPIVLFALAGRPEAEAVAVVAMAPLVLLYNVVSVVVLLASQHALGLSVIPRLVKPMATNPLIVACVLGLALSFTGVGLPRAVERSLLLVGGTAPALALIGLGAGLTVLPWRGGVGYAAAASIVKLAVTPAATLLLLWFLPLSDLHRAIALIFAACPTAVASYTLSTQLKGDAALAASCVLVSTLLALLSLGIVLYAVA